MAASYQFDKARLLSYNHTPISFENGTRYKIQKKLSVQGTLYVAYNNQGVKQTWTKAELLASAADYGEVIINGYSFGVGKITSVNFEEGNHVEKQDYTFDVECYSEIDALAFGPGLTTQQAALIDKISESVTYEIDNDANYVFTQSASVRMNLKANNVSGNELDASPDPLSMAESIIDGLFADSDVLSSNIGIDEGLFFGGGLKVIKTRSYSLVDSVCSFSRKLTVPPTYSNQQYSVALSYDLRYQNGGIVSVTEKGTILGLTSGTSNDSANSGPYLSAKAGYNIYFPSGDDDSNSSAWNRCNAVYGSAGYNFSPLPLLPKPIQKTSTFNQFKGSIDYSITFTNDPKYASLATWTFSDRVEINDNGDTIVSESGSFVGFGRPYGTGTDDRLGNAKQSFTTLVGNANDLSSPVYARITHLFQSYEVYKENTKFTLTKKSYEESHLEGSINYSLEYTDVSDYLNNTDTNVRRVEIEKTTSMPVAVTQNYSVFNFKQIIQPQNQSSVGLRTVTIKLKGKRNLDFDTYLSHAKTIAASNDPSDVQGVTAFFIKNANYSWNPNSNDFSLTVGWNFVGPTYSFGSTNLS